jgi:hypothetical protein
MTVFGHIDRIAREALRCRLFGRLESVGRSPAEAAARGKAGEGEENSNGERSRELPEGHQEPRPLAAIRGRRGGW